MVRSILRKLMLASCMIAMASPGATQLYWKSPDFRGAPVQGDEADVLIPLPGSTQGERDAEVVWTLRAGLNFAALQCQFAPSLMTVLNYNNLLTHHQKELMTDYKTLQGYFKRVAPKGTSQAAIATAFDTFNTRTYSSFSSVFAQVGFCNTASHIGETALMAPKGTLLTVARNRLRELRNSLKPTTDPFRNALPAYAFTGTDVPGYPPECFDKKGQLKKKCFGM